MPLSNIKNPHLMKDKRDHNMSVHVSNPRILKLDYEDLAYVRREIGWFERKTRGLVNEPNHFSKPLKYLKRRIRHK